MTNNPSLTFLTQNKKSKYSLEILDKISVDIEIRENPLHLSLRSLFEMGARINKKRSFLFVSKVLGKHLPVSPKVSLMAGAALAGEYMEKVHGNVHPYKEEMREAIETGEAGELLLQAVQQEKFRLPEETVFIGFAETATALGHAVFNCFENARYLHTTREEVQDLRSAISFEEEHSHATSHRCYAGTEFFDHPHPIVLVDDESTTGKTALNIIESIQAIFPRKEYTIATLLDWRTDEYREEFRRMEEKLGIVIRDVSLLSGSMEAKGASIDDLFEAETTDRPMAEAEICMTGLSAASDYQTEWVSKGESTAAPSYLSSTGRFGMDDSLQKEAGRFINDAAEELRLKRRGERTLCLGTGEFMYIPMRIAAEMGEGIHYQSTTRSPIHSMKKDGYPIFSKFAYPSPEQPDIGHFFYNVEPGMYDEVFVFLEREVPDEQLAPMLEQLKSLVPFIHVVYFCRRKGDQHAS
ncbi:MULTISPECIES: phosphoribosyltransferase family protein [Bacillaceae]|uniref:Phosphoribosyltransferase family protein n=1 Tax=Metabacillus sediminis TaxID=3117746 RepID=A0ABZ2NHF5_9BACI|nr:phosphoribosyltransferase family protein [Bacillus sp. SJS]